MVQKFNKIFKTLENTETVLGKYWKKCSEM